MIPSLLLLLVTTCEYKNSWLVSGIYGWGFAIKDTLLVVTSAYGADIINIANPDDPKLISNIMTPGLSFDVKIQNNLVFICDDYAGLRIFDISNPAIPVALGYIDTPGLASAIFVRDTIAYLADDWEGLRIINVSNPLNPVELGFFDTPGRAICVDVVDTLAYVSDYNKGLIILNIKNPANPQFVSQWYNNNLGSIDAIDVKDTLVFVTGSYLVVPQIKQFFVLNVADPANPFYVSGISLPQPPTYGFVIKDTIAFVCAQTAGIRVINIANPLNMHEITNIPGYHYNNLAICDTLLFTAYDSYTMRDHRLRVYDVSRLDTIHTIGQLFTKPYVRRVCVDNNTLFVLTFKEYTEIIAFDCTNPESILFLDSIVLVSPTDGCLYVELPYIFVGGGCLSILEFINNSFQHIFSIPRQTDAIVKKDNYLFAGTEYPPYGLYIYDITNPFSPQIVDSLSRRCDDIIIIDTFAYIVSLQWLYGINIANFQNISLVCSLNTNHYPQTIAKVPPYIIVGNGDWSIQVIDVSQPTNPQIVNDINTPDGNYHCIVSDSLLFVANSTHGLSIYDISNPVSPVLIDSCDTPAWCNFIAQTGNYVYVADEVCLGLIKFSNLCIVEDNLQFIKDKPIAYPNPFVHTTNISVPVTWGSQMISLCIYDVTGRLVNRFNDLTSAQGRSTMGENHQSAITWNGCDDNGRIVPAGTYFVTMTNHHSKEFVCQKVIKVE